MEQGNSPTSQQDNHHCTSYTGQTLTLWRYPKQAVDSPLQAWDSADLLVAESAETFLSQQPAEVLVINDAFGAICCLLKPYAPTLYTDSIVSVHALEQNLKLNNLTEVAVINQLSTIPKSKVVVLKIPKNLVYLEAILAQLWLSGADIDQVIACAKSSDITSSVIKLFNRYFSNVEVSLAKRKARVITAKNTTSSPYSSYQYWLAWQLNNQTIYNAPNVFSRASLDIGAEFLLQHLPNCNQKDVVDLACGNGVLGITSLQSHPKSVIFSDESSMAIQSAEKSCLEIDGSCPLQFKWQDCLADQAEHSADIVLCNPPFHQQKTITDHIAKQMFTDTYRVLRPNGELWVVSNKHLGYQNTLQDLFGNYMICATNPKFIIIKSIKK